MDFRKLPRRRHSAELKSAVVTACKAPGASVAAIAQAHGLNANLVHRWLRRAAGVASATSPKVVGEFVALPLPTALSAPRPTEAVAPLPDIRIELRRGATTVTVSWPLAGASDCGQWLHQWLK
ncbi:helix-turn-helix domain-containing protein [Variovorax sp. dw_954]|uniref:IS66-like element accessory protein TnpA n=1 Tax=Variovorax sp. dw_954 TaxID=2720078 RepID=UPI001BD3EB49|nr:helix-turn-helix domain-containing protein [Variovorax sp. dw_954]